MSPERPAIIAPRSMLYVPADRAEHLLSKAFAALPDAVILDLEDSVPPGRKDFARQAVVELLASGLVEVPTYVRVNGPDSAWFALDLEAVRDIAMTGVIVPKLARPADVAGVIDALGSSGASDAAPIVPLIESPTAVLDARAIAGAHPAVIGLALGAEDLRAAMGLGLSTTAASLLVARSLVVLAATAAGIWAIDSPTMEVSDLDAVALDTAASKDLGFVGKQVIHPSHVAVVHEAFAVRRQELDEAVKVLDSMEAVRTRGVTTVGDRMVDEPVVRRARLVVARSARDDRHPERKEEV